MKRKELTETFIMISNWTEPFGLHDLCKNIAAPKGLMDFNPYSVGIDFSRQSLTSVDVRFWRLKSIPTL